MNLKEFFDRPEKWTKGTFARNSSGDSVNESSGMATQFCLSMGLAKCYSVGWHPHDIAASQSRYTKLLHTIQGYIIAHSEKSWREAASRLISAFNDDPATTFEDIKNVIELSSL